MRWSLAAAAAFVVLATVAPFAQRSAVYDSERQVRLEGAVTRVEWVNPSAFVFIDVREPHEYQICKIPGTILIPLGDLPKRVNELNSADEIVAHCKSGMRSGKAVDFLRQAGFKKVKNMVGGITAWSDKVDRSVPKY